MYSNHTQFSPLTKTSIEFFAVEGLPVREEKNNVGIMNYSTVK